MENVDLDELKALVAKEKIVWKEHAMQRMAARKITMTNVINCILSGEVIENYPKDYPVPSCLILGSSEKNKMLHVVCSVHENKACIITAYFPNNDRWEDDLKTRRMVN